jgi:hypothetical protein
MIIVASGSKQKYEYTYEGNSRGSDPPGDRGGEDENIWPLLCGVPFAGDELGNAIGDELPAEPRVSFPVLPPKI